MQPLPSQRKDRSRYLSGVVRETESERKASRFFVEIEVIIIRRLVLLFLAFTIFFSSSLPISATDYDEEYIYHECYTLYPDFVNRVKEEGVSDREILSFLKSVEKYISETGEELTEENFDSYMYDAIEYALNLKKNIYVRDALAAAFPDALPDAIKGKVPEEYMPIYNTVKRILFGITTPVITLSGTKEGLLVHHLHMPDNLKVFVGVYNGEGTLLQAFINPIDAMVCPTDATYAKAFAFDEVSLAPLSESFILEF